MPGAINAKYRIALNCLGGVEPTNGARVYLVALAKSLLRREDVDLILFTARGDASELPAELRPLAYEVNVWRGRSYHQIFQASRICRALRSTQVDCWHLPNTMPLLWRPCPAVITIHDVLDLRVRKYGLLRTIYRWCVNFTSAHLADRVITVSESSKRDIVKFLGITPEKVVVIYPGVDESFSPDNAQESTKDIKRRYGIERFFLCPGGIARNKNVEIALQALSLFRRNGDMYSLLITGEGTPTEFAGVRNLIRELDLNGQVILAGCVPRELMPTLYRAASAVVYPSVCEGFGFPILESMACGCPVITANTSSLPEVAGEAAILVDPHNSEQIAQSMREVVVNDALRLSLIARGIERARSFSWTTTAAKTCDVYNELTGNSPSAICASKIINSAGT